MFIVAFLKSLRSKKRGGPMLEEILLIGIAVLVFAIIFALIFSLIDWSTSPFEDLLK